MNNTTLVQTGETKYFIIVTALSGYIGFFSLIMNCVILIFITRLLCKKTNSFLVQLIFISFIDAGASLSLFAIAQLTVRNPLTNTICASMAKGIVAFSCMSKGNIFCICVQRFIFSINLRKAGTHWRTFHTVTIVTVNVTTGILIGLIQKEAPDFISITRPVRLCSPATLQLVGVATALHLWVGLVLILSSDVLCILTVWKLKKTINDVYPANDSTQNNSTGCSSETVFMSLRCRHRHAIVTIQIILIVFTLSTLPMLILLLLQKIYNQEFDPATIRLTLLIGYIAVLTNPVFIMTRTRDLRHIIKEDITQLLRQALQCCK